MKKHRIPRKIKKLYKKHGLSYDRFFDREDDYQKYLNEMSSDYNRGIGYI